MIKSIYFKDKEFADKLELAKAVRDNLDSIIDFKKSEIFKSCEKGSSVTCRSIELSKFDNEEVKALKLDDSNYYIAVNTTGVLDSHDDLHVNGIWKVSVVDQQGKVYLAVDHDLKVDSIAARKEHIKMFTANLPFAALGYPYEGNTQALIYQIPKDKVTKDSVRQWLDSGDSIEASVRMQYVKMKFAYDSNAPENAEFKKNYDEYLSKIANKSDFDYIPYFFIIQEAKNVRESSLVIYGSNHVTGQITDPSKDSQEIKEEDPPNVQSEKSIWDNYIN